MCTQENTKMETIPYFDAHCDTITKFRPLRKNSCQVDLERLSGHRPSAQIFSVWAPDFLANGWYTMPVLKHLRRELKRNEDLVCLCVSAQEARQAAEAGRVAAFLSVEGAELLDCSAARLHAAYDLGVRMVNITWNRDNVLAGAAMDGEGGLTPRGRAFVRGCQQLGIAVDVSHLSDTGFWDVMRVAERPVLASHSNARALCGHKRNLTDAQFRAIIHNGGVAGINLYPEFLGRGRDVEAAADHMEYFLSLGGRKNICLGCDFDGVDELPAGIRGVQDVDLLYTVMRSRGWSPAILEDIFYNNLLRFLEEAL
ncbi:MAG: membrane dipeptidase [Eubacteriales bacterium]|nr:membrane dipeptidase [Eubacteriales bacterium]